MHTAMPVLTIQDERVTGSFLHWPKLKIAQELLTVRNLIEQRVRQEVAAYNARQSDVFQG